MPCRSIEAQLRLLSHWPHCTDGKTEVQGWPTCPQVWLSPNPFLPQIYQLGTWGWAWPASSSLCILQSPCPLVLGQSVWGQWEWLSLSWKATFKEKVKVTQAVPDTWLCNMEQLPDGWSGWERGWVARGFLPSFINLEIYSSYGASDKEPACQCSGHRRHGFDPWVGEDPLEEDSPLQCSCLENPMDRGARRVTTSQTWLKQLSTRAQNVNFCVSGFSSKIALVLISCPPTHRLCSPPHWLPCRSPLLCLSSPSPRAFARAMSYAWNYPPPLNPRVPSSAFRF